MKQKRDISGYVPWTIVAILTIFNLILGIALLSLYGQLARIRSQVTAALEGLSAMIDALQVSTFEYTFPIDEELPLAAEIPVEFVAQVPINTVIPVDTTVRVPVEIPLVGTTFLSVPIVANLPIDLMVDVPVQQTLSIDITVPVQFDLPVSIRVADTPLAQSLTDLQALLNDLTAELEGKGDAPEAAP